MDEKSGLIRRRSELMDDRPGLIRRRSGLIRENQA
jgi:hypothetical protein